MDIVQIQSEIEDAIKDAKNAEENAKKAITDVRTLYNLFLLFFSVCPEALL